MAENGFRRLDFGDGNEPYKYYVASRDQVLRRIFLSRKDHWRFIFKTHCIRAVRQQRALYHLYQNRIKPLYRNLHRKIAFIILLPAFGLSVAPLLS
jgi:CelD/BcsL family acetyltransferase involved in cellulose biosynthesis